jgi:hypothetical protein
LSGFLKFYAYNAQAAVSEDGLIIATGLTTAVRSGKPGAVQVKMTENPGYIRESLEKLPPGVELVSGADMAAAFPGRS